MSLEDVIYHEDLLSFEDAKISDVTPLNSTLSKAKIYVMYTGNGNAKKMYFSKEVIEAAIPSALDMPVRTFYDETATDVYGGDGDYGGHEARYDYSRGKIVRGTHPFGVIPESAGYGFETDDKGREWFWIECYLWRTCVAYEKIEELKFAHQSTELGNIAYTLDESGNVNVKSFEFQGFCVLGTKRTPAFADSSVSILFEDGSDFMAQFEELKAEVSKLMERTNGMAMNETVVVENPATETIVSDNGYNGNFELDFETIINLLRAAIRTASERPDGTHPYIWTRTASPSMVVWDEDDVTYGCSYTFDGATVNVDYANKKLVFQEWKYIEPEIEYPKFFEEKRVRENKTEEHFEDTTPTEEIAPAEEPTVDTGRIDALMNENADLKRRIATEIVSKYESVLSGNEQFEALKNSVETVSDVDVFEKDIKCAYADMKLMERTNNPEPTTPTMVEAAVNSAKPATHNARYGNLINKYSKKKDND